MPSAAPADVLACRRELMLNVDPGRRAVQRVEADVGCARPGAGLAAARTAKTAAGQALPPAWRRLIAQMASGGSLRWRAADRSDGERRFADAELGRARRLSRP